MSKSLLFVSLGSDAALVSGLVAVVHFKAEEARTCQLLLHQERKTTEAARKLFHHGPIVSGERPYSLYPSKP